jgi:hypothetical protein
MAGFAVKIAPCIGTGNVSAHVPAPLIALLSQMRYHMLHHNRDCHDYISMYICVVTILVERPPTLQRIHRVLPKLLRALDRQCIGIPRTLPTRTAVLSSMQSRFRSWLHAMRQTKRLNRARVTTLTAVVRRDCPSRTILGVITGQDTPSAEVL